MGHSAIHISENCWIAVCDSEQARLLRNKGDARRPNLATVWASFRQGKLAHDLGTNRPGRFPQPFAFGVGRGASKQMGLHQKVETDRLRIMISRLARAVRGKRAKEIIIVAPESVLGWVRSNMPRAVEHAVVSELRQDLAHCSPDGIQQHLTT